MTKRVFELKVEELRAVIGGAIYYSAFSKLPAAPALDALGKPPASDRPSVR